MKIFTLTIAQIRNETNDSKTLCFKQPSLRKIKYQAGQYITLIIKINGRRYARPYSLSSSPSADSLLEVTIKRVSGGIVSNFINDYLKIGDVLEVLEPLGTFIYDNKISDGPIFLWGVGSGITPLFSIIKEILHLKVNRPIFLIYGNKTEDSTIFREQLEFLQKQNKSDFFITNFYSKLSSSKCNDINSISGRISSDFIIKYLSSNKNIRESKHYICGPQSLKQVIINSLINLEVPKSSIFVEDFELVIDPKDMIGVQNSDVSILINGKQYKFYAPKGKSILDAALDNGLEIPYSCQTGNCNTCKGKLMDGNLKMLGLSEKQKALVKNEYLLCCSYPFSGQISLELT